MKYRITATHSANVRFEISVNVGGSSYLVIFGEHVNGLFCCIPNHKVSCEMTYPVDTGYNANALRNCDIPVAHAEAIAAAICKKATTMYDFIYS
jgi:hypothetical protein